MLIDIEINGEMRKIEAHFARNGFFYRIDRATGEFLSGLAYTHVNWTTGLDQKTGLPLNYDPNSLVQTYSGASIQAGMPETAQGVCPYYLGAPTYFKPSYDASRQMAWTLASDGCFNQSLEVDQYLKTPEYVAEIEAEYPVLWERELINDNQNGRIIAVNVATGEKVQQLVVPHMIYSGLLGTAGDLLFTGHLDGKFAAYDKDTLAELWSFNAGTPITAPPITYSWDGKQYVAIVVGGQDRSSGADPALKMFKKAGVVLVFGL